MKIGKHNISKFNSNEDIIKTGLSKSELSTGNLVYLRNDKSASNFGIVVLREDIIKYNDLLKELLKTIGHVSENYPGIILFIYRNNFSFAYLSLDHYNEKLVYEPKKYSVTHVVTSIPNDIDKIFSDRYSLIEYIMDKWNKLNENFK